MHIQFEFSLNFIIRDIIIYYHIIFKGGEFAMLEGLEELRDRLNKELENDTKNALDYERILRISQELDKLIVKFYEEKPIYNRK